MKKKIIFKGLATALVTPFRDGELDLTALERLIRMQTDSGVDALVIGGTTGEASTLTDRERELLYERARELTGGKCALIVGTGSNDTKKAIAYARLAERIGADGALAVTPYYNKGTANGIVNHYKAIANSSSVPLLLYNVPSRTGVNLSFAAAAELSEEENVVGIKEASDSLDRLTELSCLGENLPLYAGNDSHICVAMALGGYGVISVASNIIPKDILEIIDNCVICKYKLANMKQAKLLPFIKALFLETNPAPIKYIMSEDGLISPELRLPLELPEGRVREILKNEYRRLKPEANDKRTE